MLDQPEGLVYYALDALGDKVNVKIGFTTNLTQRLPQLAAVTVTEKRWVVVSREERIKDD